MNIKDFLVIFQEEFEKLLAQRTSWGRNDLKLIFEQAKTNTLLRSIE